MTQNAWKTGNLKANAHLSTCSHHHSRDDTHVPWQVLQGAVSRSPTLLAQWNRRLPHYARSTLARWAKDLWRMFVTDSSRSG